ncbi:hypothetical protein [Sphingomonas daechungensis]|uniref:hypothetical protein n=1 Tax=Sphingomonas daechungensis TaxID=1176646 RepID=UPI00378354B4
MKIAISLALVGMTAAAAALAANPTAEPSATTKANRCVPLDQIVGRRTVGPNAVEFDVVGGVTYRSELARPCAGVERLGSSAAIAITTGAETGDICEGDRVKIFDPVEVQATGLRNYPHCQLGKFTVVSVPARKP